MKKLGKNGGFTLVECVVAMAVLAIMSLLLMMILTVTIGTRNNNMSMERAIDEQVDYLVGAGSPNTNNRTEEIEFKQGATIIEKIPQDGDEGMVAEKIYYNNVYNNDDAELDALKYDFVNYQKFKDIAAGGGGTPDAPGSSDKVYGGADTSSVTISQQSASNNGDGTYTVTLSIEFSVMSSPMEGGIKVALPTGSKITGCSAISVNTSVLAISDNAVRVQPNKDGSAPTYAGNVEANIVFVIDEDNYLNSYKDVVNFYKGVGTGSSVTFSKNADGKYE